jgi:hypothetical protein
MRMLLVSLLAGVVLAATASASSQRAIVLKIGDAVDVVGTPIACFALHSNGKDGMGCMLWAKGHPIANTFGAGLAQDGTAIINRIHADGGGTTIWKRKLQSAKTVYRAGIGDEFGLVLANGVDLGCRVINVTGTALAVRYRGPRVSCWRAKGNAPLPNQYGVTLSAKIAGVFRFDAKGQVDASWSVEHLQPH